VSFSALEVLEEFAEAGALSSRLAFEWGLDRAALSAERARGRYARWYARHSVEKRAATRARWRRATAGARRARARLAGAKAEIAARAAARRTR
jgi:hypothetical protein